MSGEATAFVPAGISVWEMGTNKQIKRKADDDYNKRTQDIGTADPASTAFIFVTVRRWPGKDQWAEARRQENVWQDVRAYDADDIESWLEQAPTAHLWFSAQIGKHSDNVLDLEAFWKDWSACTQPQTPSPLVLAGRESVVQSIHEWLTAAPTTLRLQAESREEALGVFAAALSALPEEDRATALAHAVIVRSDEAARHLASRDTPLTMVIDLDSAEVATHASRRGHRIVIPLGREQAPGDGCISIPRLSVDNAAKALNDVGVSQDHARELALLARRSLLAFRRKLALTPELQQPTWARPEHGRALLAAVLCGAWDGTSDGDREVLAQLSDSTYSEIANLLLHWAHRSDPPVRKVGEVWYVVSREDAWNLLARYLDTDLLQRFDEAVVRVLATPHPRFDLPEDKRWLADVLGKKATWSPALCRGLAESLTVMATGSEAFTNGSARPVPGVSIRKLFEHARGEWRIWASWAECEVIRLLAEADPDKFLSAVDDGLIGSNPLLLSLFAKDDTAFTVSSPHTGLLWALETVAWSSDHLGYASRLLARLAEIDPGGRLTNRPLNSLREIFLPWHPQTAASPDQQLKVLDRLLDDTPGVAWRLLTQLLPSGHGVAHRTSKPKWRNWCPDQGQILRGEYFSMVEKMTMRCIQHAQTNGSRWRDLLEVIPHLPSELHEGIVEALAQHDPTAFDDESRSTIWHALRKLLSNHRSFPDAAWALPQEALGRLDHLMHSFQPQETFSRFAWLFDHRPQLPEGREGDHSAYETEVAQRQIEAVGAVYDQGGLAALVAFADCTEKPEDVGSAFARSEAASQEEDKLFSAYLSAANVPSARFARGFAYRRAKTEGGEWIETQARNNAGRWAPTQLAALLAIAPHDAHIWDLVSSLGTAIERAYWAHILPFWIEEQDAERGTREFLHHGRPGMAVNLLARYKDVAASLAVEALDALLTTPTDLAANHDWIGDHIVTLLERLARSKDTDHSVVARLELAFLPLFRHGHKPRAIHEGLALNPGLFVEAVSMGFRAESEESGAVSEEDQAKARLASELLDSWRTVPGDLGDGSIDAEVLNAWLAAAREGLATVRHEAVGNRLIGHLLSGAPRGPDGAWPHPAVRDVIESLAEPTLENGLVLGEMNSRGSVSKSPYAGGQLERGMAERYEHDAHMVSDRWPRTGAMLRRIAGSYRDFAAREDREAELRQDFED